MFYVRRYAVASIERHKYSCEEDAEGYLSMVHFQVCFTYRIEAELNYILGKTAVAKYHFTESYSFHQIPF